MGRAPRTSWRNAFTAVESCSTAACVLAPCSFCASTSSTSRLSVAGEKLSSPSGHFIDCAHCRWNGMALGRQSAPRDSEGRRTPQASAQMRLVVVLLLGSGEERGANTLQFEKSTQVNSCHLIRSQSTHNSRRTDTKCPLTLRLRYDGHSLSLSHVICPELSIG